MNIDKIWTFFSMGWTVPALSTSPCMTDASVPSSSFGVWALSSMPMSLVLESWELDPALSLSSIVLSREGSPCLTCWQCFPCCSPGGSWPSLLWGYIAGSRSAWCPPGPTGPYLQSSFVVGQTTVCTDAWDFFIPRYRTLHFSFCLPLCGVAMIFT